MSARYDGSDIPLQLQGWEVPPQVEPLLDYTGSKESGNRYDVLNGGGSFDPNGPHPLRKGEVGPNGQSSAAGRFQFIRGTWDSVAGAGTPMTEENQRRAAFKNAWLGYKQRTGRDLVSDMEEKGLTPEIAAVQDATWAGKPYSANDTLAQYGGSAPIRRESGNYQPSGGGAGDRWSEQNIPFQQQATKAGLLGMLGVNTTENERLALMKAGFRTMQTPGVLGKAIGAGGEAYVDTLMALNKQQAEIANMQTTAKGVEATGTKNRAEAEREKALAQKTAREAEFTGSQESLAGPQVAQYDANNKLVGYKRMPFDQSTGGGKFVDQSALQTFTAPDGSQQTVTNAPTDPIKMAPQVLQKQSDLGSLSGFDEEHNNKYKIIADEGGREYDKLLNTPGALGQEALRNGRSKYTENLKNYEAAASGARSNSIVNTDVIKTISNIPQDGVLVPGKAGSLRYSMANGYNTLASMMGLKDRLVPEEWQKAVVSDAEIEKMRTIATAASHSPQESFALFQAKLAANPNKDIPKDVSNRLVATNLVLQKAAIDNANIAKLYGDATANAGSQLPYVINKANPVHQYSRDINAITTLLNKSDKAQNAITYYIDGKMDKDTFDRIGKLYGVANLSRYFDSLKNQAARP